MSRRAASHPTDAELEILRILWRQGPLLVREVTEELNRVRPTGYTTALKLLQIMTQKGSVKRVADGRAHRYSAAESREGTQERMVRDLAARAFGGSASQLVERLLRGENVDRGELAAIRRLVDELESRTS